ncbi:TPA: hypothetical protein ACVU46_001890 [Vibrio parahaemolyticus]
MMMNGQRLHCASRPQKNENRCFFKVWRVGWLVSDFILKKEIILRLLKILKEVGTLSGFSDVSSGIMDGLSISNGQLTNLLVFDLSLIDEWHRVDNL